MGKGRLVLWGSPDIALICRQIPNVVSATDAFLQAELLLSFSRSSLCKGEQGLASNH